MRKKLLTGVTAILMAGVMSITAFAGQWKQDGAGWWYQSDDGSYLNNGWNWVDGKCYYFNSDGYCLQNAETPDGYTVDASGAWIVDGIIQTQGTDTQTTQAQSMAGAQVDTLNFTTPEGFVFMETDEIRSYYMSTDLSSAICVLSEIIPESYRDLINAYPEYLFDQAMEEVAGSFQGKSTGQFPTGTWYCYQYADASSLGIPGSMRVYVRISGDRLQMIMFAGELSGLDTDHIMNTCLR